MPKVRSIWGIVVAAGRGRRLGMDRPKALVPFLGRPLFLWSVELLASIPGVQGVLVAGPKGQVAALDRRLARLRGGTSRHLAVAAGGRRRQDTVRKALEWCQMERLPHDTLVLVHDAARPLIDASLVRRCLQPYAGGRFRGCVVPVLGVEDTLKVVRGRRIVDTVDRANIVRAQTPQVLPLGLALALHHVARDEGVRATDEAMLAEHAGLPVLHVLGDPRNLKITTAWDLKLAESIGRSTRKRAADRSGTTRRR
jgi:2-C-methyl-D-erythritol 4-phosphate cytidylyltransferase